MSNELQQLTSDNQGNLAEKLDSLSNKCQELILVTENTDKQRSVSQSSMGEGDIDLF